MAEIWEAEGPQGPVAIKRIVPDLRDTPWAQRMFRDEATIAAQVRHPNAVRVLEVDLTEGEERIVMERVDGLDAARAVRVGRSVPRPMPEALALHVCATVADVLAYAHGVTAADGTALGIVHRDVAPSNVLLGWDGSVRLADFGIAHAAGRIERTTTGVVKGKQGFVSPEEAMDEALGPATDVWGLGVTLHALILAMSPFSSVQALALHVAGAPLELDPSLHPGIAELVSECLELAPDARPTATDVARRASSLRHRIDPGDPGAGLAAWLHPLRRATGGLDDLFAFEAPTDVDL